MTSMLNASLPMLLVFGACAVDPELDNSEIDFTTLDGKADFSTQMKVKDSLAYHQGTTVSSTGKPKYTAVTFTGHAGDAIQASAAAGCGDFTSTWVLSSHFAAIATAGVGSCDGENGFRSSGTDRVELLHDGTYYIVFRDHDAQNPDADFDVWLDGIAAADRKALGETCTDGAYSLDCKPGLTCGCTTSACTKLACD